MNEHNGHSLVNVHHRCAMEPPAGPAASVALAGAILISAAPWAPFVGVIILSTFSSLISERASPLCGNGTKCAFCSLFLSIRRLQGLYSSTLSPPNTMKDPHIAPPKII